MSAGDYLRTKLAAQQQITSTRKPTDSSEYTHKVRLASSGTFFADGTSVGSLRRNNDETPLVGNAHPALSYKKASTGRTPLASDYISYIGSTSSSLDIIAQNTQGRKQLLCTSLAATPVNSNLVSLQNLKSPYTTASDYIRSIKCAELKTGVQDLQRDSVFVDNTIRLGSMVPSKVTPKLTTSVAGCCVAPIEKATHTDKTGIRIDVDNQRFAVGKRFFMSNPPKAQGDNVNNANKLGGYVGPRPNYIERKHGFVAPTDPIPVAPGPQGQDIQQLKINSPTFFQKV